MHAKTMEGLIGASINIRQTATPMHVYKEARQRGDTGTMERAMGYVTEFSERAVDCKETAEEEMKEEAEEMRNLKQQRLEESIEKAREEKADAEKQTQMPEVEDTLEISPEGKNQWETSVEYNLVVAKIPETDGGQPKAMMYTSKGDARMFIG